MFDRSDQVEYHIYHLFLCSEILEQVLQALVTLGCEVPHPLGYVVGPFPPLEVGGLDVVGDAVNQEGVVDAPGLLLVLGHPLEGDLLDVGALVNVLVYDVLVAFVV